MGSGASQPIDTEAKKPLDASDLKPGDAAGAIEEVKRLRAILKQELDKSSGEKPAAAKKIVPEFDDSEDGTRKTELFDKMCNAFPGIPQDDIREVVEQEHGKWNQSFAILEKLAAGKTLAQVNAEAAVEEEAEKQMYALVPSHHQCQIWDHPEMEFETKTWVERLKTAEKLMREMSPRSKAKGAVFVAEQLAQNVVNRLEWQRDSEGNLKANPEFAVLQAQPGWAKMSWVERMKLAEEPQVMPAPEKKSEPNENTEAKAEKNMTKEEAIRAGKCSGIKASYDCDEDQWGCCRGCREHDV